MPVFVAVILTALGIVFLLVRDTRREDMSGALWLPVLWMLISGSRFVSQWLELGAPVAQENIVEGSPIDAVYFSLLIFAGMLVLLRRKLSLSQLVRDNKWLFAFFLYCLVAVLWSDYPMISLKRWIKTLGHPVMALIILTDPRPTEAFRIVMKRCGYVLLTVSVLFIKYLPEYGRAYNQWTGEPTNIGVGITKNDLGYVCMIFGLFFMWNLLNLKANVAAGIRRREVALSLGFMAMAFWLLAMSQSVTSLVAMAVGASVLLLLRFKAVNVRRLGTYLIVGIFAAVATEANFDAYAGILKWLGRDPGLTDRTEVWIDAIKLQDSPILGVGFESFWLGPRLLEMWSKWWWRPNQAHNGYIEVYLNLGLVGVAILLGLLLSTFGKIKAKLTKVFDFANYRLALLFAIIIFNYTEAGFKGVHLVWTIFYIIALDLSQSASAAEFRRPGQRPAVGTGHVPRPHAPRFPLQ